MRQASAVFVSTLSCLAGILANGSANADVYDFSFGPGVSGTFTTGAATSDPGYELITGLTFGLLSGAYGDGLDFSFTNVAGRDFAVGAAFNPKTDAFINHTGGSTYNDVGDFAMLPAAGATGSIDGASFAQGSYFVSGLVVGDNGSADFKILAPLVITLQVATPVPELSTWAITLLGFGGLGLAARRLRPVSGPVA
jgi:hypothetical protein